MGTLRTLNYAVFLALLVSTWFGLSWPWGLLFIAWAVPSVLSGRAFLVGEIHRDSDPALFWAVTLLWVLFGLLMIVTDLFPAFSATWLS